MPGRSGRCRTATSPRRASLPGSGIDRENVHGLHVVWRFRIRNALDRVGRVHLDPGRRRRRRLPPGHEEQRLRARPRERAPSAGGTSSAPRTPGRTASPSPAARSTARPTRARSRSTRRPAGSSGAPFSSRPTQRFMDIAPQVANGFVYVEHDRRAAERARDAVRPRRERRARCAGSSTRSRVGGRSRSSRAAAARGTRRASAATDVYWGIANPLPVGRLAPRTRTAARSRARRSTRTRCSSRTARRAGCSGTTRSPRTTSATTTSSSRRSSARSAATPVVFGSGKGGIVIAWDRAHAPAALAVAGGRPPQRLGPAPGAAGDRVPGAARRRPHADGLRRREALRPRRRPLHARERHRLRAAREGGRRRARPRRARRARRGDRARACGRGGCRSPTSAAPPPPTASSSPATFDGTLYAMDTRDGAVLWRTRLRAGLNACPSLADGMLLVGAGVPKPGGVLEVVAYGT